MRGDNKHENSPKKTVLEKLVGKENTSDIIVENVRTIGLVDTGSAISTVSEEFLNNITPKPHIFSLDEFELEVKVADGRTLPYTGCIEATVKLPFSEASIDTLLLVVPTTMYSKKVPLIVGTNIINRMKPQVSENEEVPQAWQSAFMSLNNKQIGVVKLTNKLTLQPMEVKDVHCFVRKASSVESAITEPLDSVTGTKVGVCPRIVSLDNPGKTSRVPVRIFNMSAKVMTLPAKTNVCQLQEVKVLRSETFDKVKNTPLRTSNPPSKTAQIFQQTTDSDTSLPQVDLDGAKLSPEERVKVEQVLRKWQDVFSKGPTDLGCTNLVEHEIKLKDETPFKETYRRIPPSLIQEVREHLKEMLDIGAIRPSKSPFSSNVVIVRKKDGTIRFCIDYRKLNQRTVTDAHAIPRIDDTLHLLAGAKYFSTLDLKSGYWQVEMKEADKAKTAFQVGSLGFYECNRMPFGLCNAPATFQRLMERCMGDLNLRDCLIYLDDIIIFSSTFEEHVERLQAVFERLAEHNLKLKPSKCELFKERVSYLGHVVSEKGIHTDPTKIEAVKTWPVPKNVKDVRRFLGFTGYYRKFIQGFAAIARPLNDLLVGIATNSKARKKPAKKKMSFEWGPEQQNSFDIIIDKLTNPPVLAYANYSIPFKVHTDASTSGLGAVLYQTQEGVDRVIAYASRSLKPSERNYPAHKLEFLALKWCVTEKFHEYLYGNTFEVITDNNPLTYVLTTAKLDATGQRWIASLSDYNFTIRYRSGSRNADADGLSRRQECETEERTLFPDVIKAVSMSVSVDCPFIDSVYVSDDSEPAQHLIQDIPEQLLQSHGLTSKDWRKAQLDDPTLSVIVRSLETGLPAPLKRDVDPAFDKRYLKEWDKLLISNGVLHRKVVLNGQDFMQLVLPPVFREDIFTALHDDLGHQGRDRTMSLIKQRCFWPGMDTYIKNKVASCGRCIRRKTGSDRAELVSITSTAPMEIVCLDFLSIERSKGGFEKVLVITDHFSRYAQAIPTRNETAKTTARVLFDHFIVHYGFPARIHSDQGANFESNLIKELCKIAMVEKSRTTPYHPMGNGQVERFNQTLLKMLGTLEDHQKSDWKAHVPTLVHAYNATFHDSTGYSPYFLMFGRHPRLAVDAFLGLNSDPLSSNTQTEYVRKLRDRLSFAYKKAQEVSRKAAAKHKLNYDLRVRSSVLRPGDRVLVKNAGVRGKCKLADRWEKDPYIVMDQPNIDVPVYMVKREGRRSKTRFLHRNFLLPFMCLPCEDDYEEDTEEHEQLVNTLEGVPSGDAISDLSSDPGSEAAYDGGISDNSSCPSSSNVGKYRIPMRRKPGEQGLLPRSSATDAHQSTHSGNISSSTEGHSPRPVRARRKPPWMRSNDWVIG